jgi:hypothetical protein
MNNEIENVYSNCEPAKIRAAKPLHDASQTAITAVKMAATTREIE